ncbi:MAG: DUF2071 domain-containing protein [Pyrinomonadaceae bacterium]|nr:DUF2071 domain-containing protein [Pyrinomonadaceae bacterium]
MKKFLTAKWLDLIMANYSVSPDLLRGLVPKGVSLDEDNRKIFVSLVAFRFENTRVLGLPIPFHQNFDEVNLRFYVKRETPKEIRRGVTFIKEFVPRFAIAFIARTLYGEPYEALPMAHEKNGIIRKYSWIKDGKENSIKIELGKNLGIPDAGSHEEFIIEHYWGYTKRSNDRTDEYRVEHPKWEVFDAAYVEIDVDFGLCYGKQFSFLTETEPDSVFMAKGSEISVFKGAQL